MEKEQKTAGRKKKQNGCSGEECYYSVEREKTIFYTYQRDVDEEDKCRIPNSQDEVNAIHHAFNLLEQYAEKHCEANGAGNAQCRNNTYETRNCKCKPELSNRHAKTGSTKRIDDRCQLEVTVSALITCRCKED